MPFTLLFVSIAAGILIASLSIATMAINDWRWSRLRYRQAIALTIARSITYQSDHKITIPPPGKEFEFVVTELQEVFPKAHYWQLSDLAYEALKVTSAQCSKLLPD